ncbi:hypothetical protein JOF41_006213 [Saccharothrix coeruleofusca]|uniref:SdrD B-like domain-containing protein n=1 Tax=Saccharothrix coeruleofusca TaxID=33919 RepID=UPI001AE9E453|nr:SdrD B-like domain-containing protein [Saccharothrix coeruleofusca]MBP2340035.1 hypothetical protein [Saccharothrix coeruleofusca]
MNALVARRLARRSTVLAAAATFALCSTAHAQETSGAVPTGTSQAPSGSSAPETPKSADKADVSISATVVGGPYLVGEQVPVDVVITNRGGADATAVKASAYSTSGSSFSVQPDQWGDLATWPGPGITLPAGQRRVLTVRGEVRNWDGVAAVRFAVHSAEDNGWDGNNYADLVLPLRDPGSATDSVAGVVYGDGNGNGAPDAGEALAGVPVRLAMWSENRTATTDAEGRFRFDGLPARVYHLTISDAPGGWVVDGASYAAVRADGNGSAANLVYRARRPLTDQLSASMRFTRDTYHVGDRARVEVTLTNGGPADVTGVKTFCDRSGGEGPELREVDLGELSWDAPGVTVPAGGSRTFTISGSVSEESGEYGGVTYGCDFGPQEFPEGHPAAYAVARVAAPPADTYLVIYHDRDGDWTAADDERVRDVPVGLVDAQSGALVAKARTDGTGRVDFRGVQAGPYRVKVYGPWRLTHPETITFVGSCRNCTGLYLTAVPGPEVPEEDVSSEVPADVPAAAPTGAPNSTTAAPAGRAEADGGGTSTGEGLARTGASVLGLGALGALVLVAGTAALVLGRRRARG